MDRKKYVPMTKEERTELIDHSHTAPQYWRKQ